jgi:hypothetical protein
VFRRGKHRGRALEEVAAAERDYLEWMLGADDMDDEVLALVRDALAAAVAAAHETFPAPTGPEAPPPVDSRA